MNSLLDFLLKQADALSSGGSSSSEYTVDYTTISSSSSSTYNHSLSTSKYPNIIAVVKNFTDADVNLESPIYFQKSSDDSGYWCIGPLRSSSGYKYKVYYLA